ncbi:MAG: hypothetical protein ACU0A8_13625 [Limimaricola soesokkakensis]
MTRILFATPLVLPAPALAHAGAAHLHAGWAGPVLGLALVAVALVRGLRA